MVLFEVTHLLHSLAGAGRVQESAALAGGYRAGAGRVQGGCRAGAGRVHYQ